MKRRMQNINKTSFKGRIALYTAIISMMMVSVVFYLMPSIDNKLSYSSVYSEYLLKENADEEKRETYLTDFNEYFRENFIGNTNDDIKQFMSENRQYLFTDLKDKDGVRIYYLNMDPKFKLTISGTVLYIYPEISGEKLDNGHSEIEYIIKEVDDFSDVKQN